MSTSLTKIKQPIADHIDTFERRFRESMKSKVSLLDKIMYYIVKHKGKQMRPMFVLFSAQLGGEINDKSYRSASFIELLHTATLVHDDVVDDSQKRRGIFSINALWKNKIAVLVGDYLFSKGFLLSLEYKDYFILEIVSEAIKQMSEGELLQMEKARKLDIDEQTYYDIIRQKTATLIAAACSVGLASTTEDAEKLKIIHGFGEKVGMAFQIKDDIFDFGGDSIGKPTGIDIKEKKMTLPLIISLQNADKATKRHIMKLIKNHSEDKAKVKEVIEFVWKNGGIEYANQKMIQLQNEAFELLHKFPESTGRTGLEELVRFTIERKK